MKAKREKVTNCEICQNKFSVLKSQHQCKRCLRAVCSDCASDSAIILRIAHVDSTKHRLCVACKQELNHQKRQREDQNLKFNTDSTQAKKWLTKLGGTEMANSVYNAAQKAELIKEEKNQVTQEMRQFDAQYEKERLNINFSWFDMIHYLTEGVEKKAQLEVCKKIISNFLTKNPSIGFTKEMIPLVIYLLSYCSESTAYYLFSTLYSIIVPEYLYPTKFKMHGNVIDEDIQFILNLLQLEIVFKIYLIGQVTI